MNAQASRALMRKSLSGCTTLEGVTADGLARSFGVHINDAFADLQVETRRRRLAA